MNFEIISGRALQLFLIFAAFEIFTITIKTIRSSTKPFEEAAFIVTTAFAILAFCFGPVIQSTLLQTFYSSLPGQYGRGLIYELEFHPTDVLLGIENGFLSLSNIFSAVLLATLLWLIRARNSSVSAILSAALILMINDLLTMTTSALLSGYYSLLWSYRGLGESLICDIFGGVIVGYICLSILRRTNSIAAGNGVKIALREMTFTILKFFGVAALSLMLIFFVFVWPEPETISASLIGTNQLALTYASPAVWTVSPARSSLVGNPEIAIDAPQGPLASVEVFQTTGCQSDDDAMKIAQSSQKLSYNLMGHSLEVGVPFASSTKLISSKKDAYGALVAQAGTQVSASVSGPENFSTMFFGPAKLELLGGTWTMVVEEPFGQIADIDARQEEHDYILTTKTGTNTSTACQAVTLQPKSATVDWRLIMPTEFATHPVGARVVIVIPDAGKSPYVPMAGVAINFPRKSSESQNAGWEWPAGMLNELGLTATDGTVSIGTRNYDKVSSLFVAGDLLQLNWDPTGHLILTGTSNYVVSNDDLVTFSLYEHLPNFLQAILFTGSFAFILWLQPQMRDGLIRFFKGKLD